MFTVTCGHLEDRDKYLPQPFDREDSHGRRDLGFLGLGYYMNFRDRAKRAKTQSDPMAVPTIGPSVYPNSKEILWLLIWGCEYGTE